MHAAGKSKLQLKGEGQFVIPTPISGTEFFDLGHGGDRRAPQQHPGELLVEHVHHREEERRRAVQGDGAVVRSHADADSDPTQCPGIAGAGRGTVVWSSATAAMQQRGGFVIGRAVLSR